MIVKDFLRQLATTRLKNTAIVDLNQTTGIKTNFIEPIIYLLNQSLTSLHTEFCLLKKSVLLKLFPPYTEYYLRKEYALTNSTVVLNKYIRDTVENPFYPYLIRVVSIFDQDGNDIPINDRMDSGAVHTITYDCLQFSHLNAGEYFTVVYLANHLPLTSNGANTEIISLPPIMYELLGYLLASKYYLDLGKNSADGQNNLINYNELKSLIIQNNSIPDFQNSHRYLEQKGFV